jgi:hypothetical protein
MMGARGQRYRRKALSLVGYNAADAEEKVGQRTKSVVAVL